MFTLICGFLPISPSMKTSCLPGKLPHNGEKQSDYGCILRLDMREWLCDMCKEIGFLTDAEIFTWELEWGCPCNWDVECEKSKLRIWRMSTIQKLLWHFGVDIAHYWSINYSSPPSLRTDLELLSIAEIYAKKKKKRCFYFLIFLAARIQNSGPFPRHFCFGDARTSRYPFATREAVAMKQPWEQKLLT